MARRKLSTKLVVLAIAVLVCLAAAGTIYRVFFISFARVPTGGMMNTILIGDQLIVSRSLAEIGRGTVVVFEYPGDSARYVGRIIGLPGETIEVRNRSVYIDGHEILEQKVIARELDSRYGDPLEELSVEGFGPYRVYYTRDIGSEAKEPPVTDDTMYATGSPFRIPDDNYFLLGDNRDNSEDSRYRGTVPRKLIFGRITIVYWSGYQDENHQEHIRWNRIFTRIR